jgi:site-specific DNA recombinase
MTAAWAKGKMGTRYAYYWCFTKGCAQARKNIRKEKLETAFDALLNSVRPTQELLFAAQAMFKVIWTTRESEARERTQEATRELQGIERKIEQLVARLVETEDAAIIRIYEAQLRKLHDRKTLLAEKAATGARPKKSFEESFELPLNSSQTPENYGIPAASSSAGRPSDSCLGGGCSTLFREDFEPHKPPCFSRLCGTSRRVTQEWRTRQDSNL